MPIPLGAYFLRQYFLSSEKQIIPHFSEHYAHDRRREGEKTRTVQGCAKVRVKTAFVTGVGAVRFTGPLISGVLIIKSIIPTMSSM